MTAQRLRLKTAAELYDVTYQKLWEAVKADRLPAEKLEGRWYVRPSDMEDYFAQNAEPNEAEKSRRAEKAAS